MVNKICSSIIQVLIVTVTLAGVGWNYFEIESNKLTGTSAKEGIGITIGAIESKSEVKPKPKANSKSKQEANATTSHFRDEEPPDQTGSYKHNFTYDRERWERNSPRIAVLVGPHKTASTTIQAFLANVAGSGVILSDKTVKGSHSKVWSLAPHPAITDWVWPIGVKEEFKDKSSLGGGIKPTTIAKFYAPLACLLSGRMKYFPVAAAQQTKVEKKKVLAKAAEYYRSIFRQTWDEGKNIVIGAEAFDRVVQSLLAEDSAPDSDEGMKTHIAPDSGATITSLLNLFPWDNNTNTNAASRNPPLELQDIEVHVNYRTPRIDHIKSIWHQLGPRKTLRDYLIDSKSLYLTNSLALALQFARRGIKTSIVDMAGVPERAPATNETSTEAVIGGLQGVVACDILRMNSCDDHGRLHLPGYEKPVKDQNMKKDKSPYGLTPEQLDEIERVMNEYDCGAWQHLKKYQDNGTLRILYPIKDRFGTCDPKGSRDISFKETWDRVQEIVSRPV